MKRFECCVMILFLMSICLFISCGGDSNHESNYSNDNNSGDGGETDDYWYDWYECLNGDSYYCVEIPSSTACNIIDLCGIYGCNASTGRCNTSLPNGSDNGEQQPPSEIPECSSAGLTPCKDSSSKLVWSARSDYEMSWSMAIDYCNNLYKSGYKDWRLPSIDELRTLIENCPNIESGGECPVSENNSSLSSLYVGYGSCHGCESDDYTNKLNEREMLWSSSEVDDEADNAWYIYFPTGEIAYWYKYEDCEYDTYNMCGIFVRCVRSDF